MSMWTADKAFKTIYSVNGGRVRVDEKQLAFLRKKFVEITVFGELKYNSESFQIWQDENKDIAYINNGWREGCVVYKGITYVVSE